MFSHYGASGPESIRRTTLCLVEFAWWRHQSAAAPRAPEVKFAVLGCLVLDYHVAGRVYQKA